MRGTIKSYQGYRRFGFIKVGGGRDLFFHETDLPMELYKLGQDRYVGAEIEFAIAQGKKGPYATDIRLIRAPLSLKPGEKIVRLKNGHGTIRYHESNGFKSWNGTAVFPDGMVGVLTTVEKFSGTKEPTIRPINVGTSYDEVIYTHLDPAKLPEGAYEVLETLPADAFGMKWVGFSELDLSELSSFKEVLVTSPAIKDHRKVWVITADTRLLDQLQRGVVDIEGREVKLPAPLEIIQVFENKSWATWTQNFYHTNQRLPTQAELDELNQLDRWHKLVELGDQWVEIAKQELGISAYHYIKPYEKQKAEGPWGSPRAFSMLEYYMLQLRQKTPRQQLLDELKAL